MQLSKGFQPIVSDQLSINSGLKRASGTFSMLHMLSAVDVDCFENKNSFTQKSNSEGYLVEKVQKNRKNIRFKI